MFGILLRVVLTIWWRSVFQVFTQLKLKQNYPTVHMFQIYKDKGNILHFSKFFVLFCFPIYTRVLYQLKFSGEAGSIGYRYVLKYVDIYIEKDRDIEILKNWLLCLWAWQTLKSVGQSSRLETQEGFLCHSLDTDILLLETTVFWFLVFCCCCCCFCFVLFCFAFKSFKWLCVCCSAVSDSLWPYGLYPTRLHCPCNSAGRNTGVACHLFLQGVFPTWGSNPVSCIADGLFPIWVTKGDYLNSTDC